MYKAKVIRFFRLGLKRLSRIFLPQQLIYFLVEYSTYRLLITYHFINEHFI